MLLLLHHDGVGIGVLDVAYLSTAVSLGHVFHFQIVQLLRHNKGGVSKLSSLDNQITTYRLISSEVKRLVHGLVTFTAGTCLLASLGRADWM